MATYNYCYKPSAIARYNYETVTPNFRYILDVAEAEGCQLPSFNSVISLAHALFTKSIRNRPDDLDATAPMVWMFQSRRFALAIITALKILEDRFVLPIKRIFKMIHHRRDFHYNPNSWSLKPSKSDLRLKEFLNHCYFDQIEPIFILSIFSEEPCITEQQPRLLSIFTGKPLIEEASPESSWDSIAKKVDDALRPRQIEWADEGFAARNPRTFYELSMLGIPIQSIWDIAKLP